MIKQKELKELLRNFNKKGYSDSGAKYESNCKNGKILVEDIGEFRYEDEFYGGEPYCGNETIWEKGVDIFRCVYWGKVIPGISFSDIYDFLRKALSKGPDGELVHRGPNQYIEGDLKYTNSIEGNIDEFRQTERIYIGEKEVYTAYFFGGRVNAQR